MCKTWIFNSLAGYILRYSYPLYKKGLSTNFAKRSVHFVNETRARIIMESFIKVVLYLFIFLNTNHIHMLLIPSGSFALLFRSVSIFPV